MPTKGFGLDAFKTGSMVDSIDSAQHPLGTLKEMRNARHNRGWWRTRLGWAKDNVKAMPWDYCIGMHAYRDTRGRQHILVMGGDGNLYRNNQEGDFSWHTPVTLNDAVVWDETYTACFAPWFDDCFITLGSIDGTTQNLRYSGLTGQAYGVSLGAPTGKPAIVDSGVGTLDSGSWRIAYTFYDVTSPDTIVESSYSPVSDALVLAANRRITISNIDTYGGSGRTIHRRIYASIDGEAFTHVATIGNNTATTYVLSNTSGGSDSVYQPSPVIPVTKYVALNANGIPIWCNDAENDLPATIYISQDQTHVESVAVNLNTGNVSDGAIQTAGSHDDPITGPRSMRDGVMIFKRRSIHYLPRECQDCERLVTDVGCVAWATIVAVGSTVYFLSPNGPMKIDHYQAEDVSFVGADPHQFCLSEWWDGVNDDALPFAAAVHIPSKTEIRWFVQRCADSGLHNDTAIVLNYSTNRVHIHDMLIDYACIVPVEASEEDVAWGAFPGGFVGPLCDGIHGDGVDTQISGYVLQADGTTVWVNDAGWGVTGDGVAGSVLYVWDGLGNMLDSPCDRSKALITSHAAGTLELTGELSLDTTSRYWIGGFGTIIDLDGIDVDDPNSVKTMERVDIQLKV
jgi:hypothetical protein